MRLPSCVGTLLLALHCVVASPINEKAIEVRDAPSYCKVVTEIIVIVGVMEANKATGFCSSLLGISTQTVTASTTSYVFASGTPPAKLRRDVEIEARGTPSVPAYLSTFVASELSSACSCLSLPTQTVTVTPTKTEYRESNPKKNAPTISTNGSTPLLPLITIANPTFPACAGTSSALYGLATPGPNVGGTQNDLYGDGTTGTSLQGCCELCYFGVPNCIQAFYYFYEGCVVQHALSPTGTGVGESAACPNGVISGLTYGPDGTTPPFRSTGDIAGPCGSGYTNF
ncbi:MAG: hypothetical protein M1827_005015 [Pycnora praestabilis]|nr:MAG: hypothetical protein M1827_005015 [Pycnora praestabilis]